MSPPISQGVAVSNTALCTAPQDEALDFTSVYRAEFAFVMTWLRALGIPASDREDVAQEVFLVVRRKLISFDGGNLRGWLYRITQRTASDHRRRVWFRSLLWRASPEAGERLPCPSDGPPELYEHKEAAHRLERLIAGLDEKLRVAFWLFEIEGNSAQEIAAIVGVTEATVWTRVYRARADLLRRFERQERREARRSW
jgi:RNA polymerase sigma-70 factor (ECF subfamily)